MKNHTEIFKFIKKNGTIVSSITPSKAGTYYFTPYYDNKEINCSYCRKKIITDKYDLKFTSLRVKKAENWDSKNNNNFYYLYKKNFPIFKIVLRDLSESIFTGKVEDLNVELVNEKENINIKMNLYQTNKGIYSYLSEEGINTYKI